MHWTEQYSMERGLASPAPCVINKGQVMYHLPIVEKTPFYMMLQSDLNMLITSRDIMRNKMLQGGANWADTVLALEDAYPVAERIALAERIDNAKAIHAEWNWKE